MEQVNPLLTQTHTELSKPMKLFVCKNKKRFGGGGPTICKIIYRAYKKLCWPKIHVWSELGHKKVSGLDG